MSIHAGDHVDLCVSRIALSGLQVAMVEFQLVGRAGMSEGMKNDSGQSGLLAQLFKFLQDDTILARPTIGQRHH